MISEPDRQQLLRIARDAVTAHVCGTRAIAPELTPATARLAGAFVTLHIQGALRGCIGHVAATEPLGRIVARTAVAAATSDPRFPPIGAPELADLQIELSILGPLERVSTIDDIEIGRHGLVVEKEWCRGLLLPQVATEWRWDRIKFLEQTCHKAGLSHDAWKQGAMIWKFEAEVFGEPGAGGAG